MNEIVFEKWSDTLTVVFSEEGIGLYIHSSEDAGFELDHQQVKQLIDFLHKKYYDRFSPQPTR